MSITLKSNVAYGGSAANLPPFLMADIYPSMYVAYSTRQLSTTYEGAALRVRRDSDNAELDIGFTSSYLLDEAALLSFVGVGDGFVTKFYDQTGNGRDAVQATTTLQPKIVAAGVVTKSAGVPGLLFDGTSDYLDMALAVGAFKNTNRSQWIASLKSTKVSGNEGIFAASATNGALSVLFVLDMVTSTPRKYNFISRRTSSDTGGSAQSADGHSNDQIILTGDTNWIAGTSAIRQNGVVAGTGTLTSTAATQNGNSLGMKFGSNLGVSAWFGGYLTELVIFNSNGENLMPGVEVNMAAYVGL